LLGKIKPETYTADGVEHKTFSIKADYIRKIDYSAPSEASESKAAKPPRRRPSSIRATWRRLFGAAFLCPLKNHPVPRQRLRYPPLPYGLALDRRQ